MAIIGCCYGRTYECERVPVILSYPSMYLYLSIKLSLSLSLSVSLSYPAISHYLARHYLIVRHIEVDHSCRYTLKHHNTF